MDSHFIAEWCRLSFFNACEFMDRIDLLISVPPYLSASKLMQYIKGNTSRKLQMEYKELNKQFWRE